MKKWLGRLAFSFLIIGGFLLFEGYQTAVGRRGEPEAWRVGVYMVAGVMSLVLGLAGVRERHRVYNDEARMTNDE